MKKVLTIIVMLVVLACAVSAQTFGGRSSSSVYILPPHKMFFGEDDGTSPSLTKGGTNKLRLSGYFDFQLYPYTVATLPAASANRGRIYLVTDGSANTDCTGGGGSTYAVCVSDGVNWFALAGAAGAGSGDVTGPSSSVDSEVALFSGTSGKALKRASLTGLLKLTAGVASAASAGTDYAAPNASTTVNGQSCALGSSCTVADSTKVPTTTTVAGKALSGNITLAQTDLTAGNYTIGAYYIDQAEIAAPANPAAGVCREYVDSTTHIKTWKNSSGTSCGPATGSGTPGGSDTQVQFNDGGSFGGDPGMTYNKTTDTLTVGAVATSGSGPDTYTAIADGTTANSFWLSSTTANTFKAYLGGALKVFAFTDSNITGTAAGLSGTPSLPNGTTATTQSADDNSTKVATTAYVDRMKTRAIAFTIGSPTGSALTTSDTAYVTVPFACTISAYNLAFDATDATAKIKFWKVATGTAIPTSGNSINTSGVGVSSGTAVHSTTLSDFTTTTVSANDILAMNLATANTVKMVNGVLQCDQ